MGEPRDIVSFACRDDLSRKKVVKLARQYEGIDMASLMGADDENFPFVIEGEVGRAWFWNAYNGIVSWIDEDPVRSYATIQYLRDNAYPIFKTIEDAERYAKERDWPRKAR
jgi:hypothetical protein